MQIAQATGTRLHAWEEDEAIFAPEGHRLDPAEAAQYARLLWDDGVIVDAFRYSNEHHDAIDPARSLYDFFAEKAAHMFTGEAADVARRKRETFLLVASMWGAYIGSPVARQSLKFFWLEECIEGENPFVADTYRKVLDAVARPAVEGAEIRLGAKVTGISSMSGGEHHMCRLETADGSTAVFDEVVVTTPLGWLKRNKAAFEPPLPPRLSQAIDNIGYGTLDKVYITFASAFWQTASTTPQRQTHTGGIDPKGNTPNVTATTAPLHQSPSLHTAETHYPGFTHWLAPTYASRTNVQRWDQNGVDLAALPDKCAHPTILFYIYGACSKHIADLVASSTSDADRDERLLEFFQPYYSRLPNYEASNRACNAKAVLATTWALDEFAGYGSYCNFQVGLERGDEDIEVMRHGMPERGVWLAGEHAAPFVALGTSTGAWWSGEGVAERIAKSYGLQQRSS